MGFKFGVSDDLMSNEQWHKSGESTFASVIYDDGKDLVQCELLKNLKTKTFGDEHAEDVFLRIIPEYLKGVDAIPLVQGKQRIFLSVSKSPCSSRCAPNLINFVQNWPNVELTIIVRGLYAGDGGVEESQASVEAMRSAGIVVSSDVRSYNPRTKRFEVAW